MTTNISKCRKLHKKEYKNILRQIKSQTKETELINYIFPIIHGLKLTKEQIDYQFNNIVEAREYLNDSMISKNIQEICKEILKLDSLEFLNETDLSIIKASLTLFSYITDPNIKSLLTFRNYDNKDITKFYNSKNHTIFKKILDKFFNHELDNSTLHLIESEIYTFSERNIILKNIDKQKIKEAEDILIKYSEVTSIVLENNNGNTTTIKEFYKSLSKEEYKLFSQFNINKKRIKRLKKEKHKIQNTITLCIFLFLFLTSITIVSFKINTSIIIFGKNINYNKLSKINENTKENLKKVTNIYIEEKIREEKQVEEEKLAEEARKAEEERLRRERENNYQQQISQTAVYVEATGIGNQDMVNIAQAQVGNIGGKPFWSWYGFSGRVSWCGAFVSWVANQAGVSETIIPKFAAVRTGIKFYTDRQLWRNRSYEPRPGDLIFFDYNYDGLGDHVGLVKTTSNGRVFTIEGNASDKVKELSYKIGDRKILGYGTPNY